MALDGLYLACLRGEIADTLVSRRVDKIFQPSREELVLTFHSRDGAFRLYGCVRGGEPRVHLTEARPENPASPPMFCMLLRKHLTGGRLAAVRQNGAERVLYFDFDATDELGDPVRLTLVAELMGKHSNVILVDGDGRIVDALRRVTLAMSESRPLLPGARYTPPPALADRLDVALTPPETVLTAVCAETDPLPQALLSVTQGLSPLLCRELAARADAADTPADRLSEEQRARLSEGLCRVRRIFEDHTAGRPLLLCDEKGVPTAFSCLPLLQYGLAVPGRVCESYSAVLDAFYAERTAALRQKQRTAELTHFLTTARERLQRKILRQQRELAAARDREPVRIYADLINANAHAIPRGAAQASLINYYDPDCAPLTVPLDPALSAAQNAQKYYKAYRKAQTAERVLTEQIEKGEAERLYFDSVTDALQRAETTAEVAALRRELEEGGYLTAPRGAKRTAVPMEPKRFLSDDGFVILVGRNNGQNDRLTTKTARGSDIWFHVKNSPGSHVVVLTNGETPPDRTLEQAAVLAALHSRAAASQKVPVDYTAVRNVHKPAGAKPGFVIYEAQHTAYVTPDSLLAARLAARMQENEP